MRQARLGTILPFSRRCARIAFVGDWRYYAWMGALTVVCLLGLNAYCQQFVHGLIVTGMSDQVSWGVYIANFTFLVGVAAAAVMMVIPGLHLRQQGPARPRHLRGTAGRGGHPHVPGLCHRRPGAAGPFLAPDASAFNFPNSMLSWDVIVLNGYLLLNLHICGYLIYCRYRKTNPRSCFTFPSSSSPSSGRCPSTP